MTESKEVLEYVQAFGEALYANRNKSKPKMYQAAAAAASQAQPDVHRSLSRYPIAIGTPASQRTEVDWAVIEAVQAKSAGIRAVMRRIRAEQNGNNGSGVIRLSVEEPESEEDISSLPMSQLYRRLVDSFNHIPNDKMLAWITGYKTTTFLNIRSEMKQSGYNFSQTTDGWNVIARPVVDPREAQVVALRRQMKSLQAQLEALKQ